MKSNFEIEFKTFISPEDYVRLVTHFSLENNIFKQVNYYFDTPDYFFKKNNMVLRIRKRGEDYYKVTLKTAQNKGACENHILLSTERALEMLENGFKADMFDFNHEVALVAELENYRVSTPYRDGVLFFDKTVCYGITDYEIEYEVEHFEQGKKDFYTFLESLGIPYKQATRKSTRAYERVRKG